jgi:hypothetical protein
MSTGLLKQRKRCRFISGWVQDYSNRGRGVDLLVDKYRIPQTEEGV